MTRHREPDELLDAYLAEGMQVLPDRVVDAVLDEVHRTRQRAVFGPWRIERMNTVLKLALATAAVIAVAVIGSTFLPRNGSVIGGPGVATPSPGVPESPAPSPSDQAFHMLVAGTDLTGPGLGLTTRLPQGWSAGASGPQGAYAAAIGGAVQPPAGIGFFVSVIDNTFKDPCTHVQRSPKVGPTTADAATALGAIPNTRSTAPVQTTFAGHAATYLELTTPASLPCVPAQFYLWQDSPGADWFATGPNETIRVWIVEVGNQRVAIAARSYPATSDVAKAQLQGILDSIVFEGAPSQSSSSPVAS